MKKVPLSHPIRMRLFTGLVMEEEERNVEFNHNHRNLPMERKTDIVSNASRALL